MIQVYPESKVVVDTFEMRELLGAIGASEFCNVTGNVATFGTNDARSFCGHAGVMHDARSFRGHAGVMREQRCQSRLRVEVFFVYGFLAAANWRRGIDVQQELPEAIKACAVLVPYDGVVHHGAFSRGCRRNRIYSYSRRDTWVVDKHRIDVYFSY